MNTSPDALQRFDLAPDRLAARVEVVRERFYRLGSGEPLTADEIEEALAHAAILLTEHPDEDVRAEIDSAAHALADAHSDT